MPNRCRPFLSAASLAGLLVLAPRFTPAARGEEPCTPRITVSGSIGGADQTAYAKVLDRNVATSLTSPRKGWQYVDLDFACPVKLRELRRHMTRNGTASGPRDAGEGIFYSLDGVRWRDLTRDDTLGWQEAQFFRRDSEPEAEGRPRYRGAFWKRLPYGWSPALRMRSAVYARFVRFNWHSIGDSLHELEVGWEPAETLNADWRWDLTRWDWTTNELFQVNYQDDVRDPAQPVTAPWNESHGECRQENPDIAPENGWVLLAGNLGTSPFMDLPAYPYFFLYNKYRGTVRSYFFYGNRSSTDPSATHQMGSLVVEDGAVPAFTHHTATTLVDYDAAYEEFFMKKHMRVNEWACLSFDVVGYDPDVASKSAPTFMLRFYKLLQSTLEAQGNESLNGSLDAADLRTGKSGSDWDTVADVGGHFLRGAAVFGSAPGAVDKVLDIASNSTGSSWWENAIQGAATALSSGDVKSFIESLGGFISGIVSGGGDSQVPLSWRVELTGDFQFNGTISTASDLAGVRFYVPGSSYGRDPKLLPLYDEPLGVYALTYKPTIDWYSRQDGRRAVDLVIDPSWVVLNPQAGLQLVSAKAALVSRSHGSRAFRDLGYYFLEPYALMTDGELDRLKVGLRLELQRVGQPFAEPIVMYQEYEADKVYMGVEPVSGGQ
jgi:hypothetical protein